MCEDPLAHSRDDSYSVAVERPRLALGSSEAPAMTLGRSVVRPRGSWYPPHEAISISVSCHRAPPASGPPTVGGWH
jgi:hypothetical protein